MISFDLMIVNQIRATEIKQIPLFIGGAKVRFFLKKTNR